MKSIKTLMLAIFILLNFNLSFAGGGDNGAGSGGIGNIANHFANIILPQILKDDVLLNDSNTIEHYIKLVNEATSGKSETLMTSFHWDIIVVLNETTCEDRNLYDIWNSLNEKDKMFCGKVLLKAHAQKWQENLLN